MLQKFAIFPVFLLAGADGAVLPAAACIIAGESGKLEAPNILEKEAVLWIQLR